MKSIKLDKNGRYIEPSSYFSKGMWEALKKYDKEHPPKDDTTSTTKKRAK